MRYLFSRYEPLPIAATTAVAQWAWRDYYATDHGVVVIWRVL